MFTKPVDETSNKEVLLKLSVYLDDNWEASLY
jgi:hypothetical protein